MCDVLSKNSALKGVEALANDTLPPLELQTTITMGGSASDVNSDQSLFILGESDHFFYSFGTP